MTQPVSYLQTDPRWKDISYSAKGESTTIGASGCGPTAMAMVLATWAAPNVTPETECAWALAHGYKAPHQGTYYGYFTPAAARYGLTCTRVNGASLYGNAGSDHHRAVKAAVDRGDLVIACMGKGNWTRSGHYVLVWKIDGDVIYINDPASTRASRTRGSYPLFRQQVKYYWLIRQPETQRKEEMDVTQEEVKQIIQGMTEQEAYELFQKAMHHAAQRQEPAWSQAEGYWQRAAQGGIVDGKAPERPAKRDEVVTMLGHLGLF